MYAGWVQIVWFRQSWRARLDRRPALIFVRASAWLIAFHVKTPKIIDIFYERKQAQLKNSRHATTKFSKISTHN
jgi:hypothetical protein